jgi:hypothetical protein
LNEATECNVTALLVVKGGDRSTDGATAPVCGNPDCFCHGDDTMNIERLFGKGREGKATPRPKDKGGESRSRPAAAQGAKTVTSATPPGGTPSSARGVEAASTGSAMTPAPTRPTIAVAVLPEPSFEEIAARAYEIWDKQGRPPGRERDNWIDAERQLRAERASN